MRTQSLSVLVVLLTVWLLIFPAPAAAAALDPTVSAGSDQPLPQLFEAALDASREGRFGEALPLWDQVVELAPEEASAWSNRGNVLLALGNPEAAIDAQGRAL